MAGALGWGVSLAAESEQAKIAFTTMLGSATQAKTLLGELSRFAATTPYESPEVISAGKQLLAYGIEAEKIVPTLRKLGDIASGVGAPLGDIAYLFGTAKTQGRLPRPRNNSTLPDTENDPFNGKSCSMPVQRWARYGSLIRCLPNWMK